MKNLHEDKDLFAEFIDKIVVQTGLEPEFIEKDYYVTMILRDLAKRFEFSVFKGGTSLQKCYQVISRFSEDIDITIDQKLTDGKKKALKYGIIDIAESLGMKVENTDQIRSRRDYNQYQLSYHSVLTKLTDFAKPMVLLETSFTEISFPVKFMPVHSYIGTMLDTEAPELIKEYGLEVFPMKVQEVERTLIDKVFAVCDYYLSQNETQYSRHIYDIYKLLQVVPLNGDFRLLVKEVRDVRSKKLICKSAMPGIDIPDLLNEIVRKDVYKEDYNYLTVNLLEEDVSYEEALTAIKQIADSGMFAE